MIKVFKSNKFISILLVIMCIIIIFNPSYYAKSCLNAISVWTFKVLPIMFPFFIFTRLISNLTSTQKNFMDKFFNKLYNTPPGTSLTYFLSTISGYPMGAKLICSMLENKQISQSQAKKMLSICSVSGPMFMIGTVGVAILNSFSAGVVILISNIIASLLNGFIYRGKKEKLNVTHNFKSNSNSNILSSSVYDSLVSILMIGCYIVLSFIVIDMANNFHIFDFLAQSICDLCNIPIYQNVVKSTLTGVIEITRGILDLSKSNISLRIKSIITSTLIGFGGVSVMLQNVSFLTNSKISSKTIFKQKLTQALFCLLTSSVLSFLIL